MNRILVFAMVFLVAGGLFAPIANAATIGFDFGLNDNGGFGVMNTSEDNPWSSIVSLTLTFNQGTTYETGTNPFSGATGVAGNTPDNAATDGQTSAIFTFYGSGFTTGNSYSVNFGVNSPIAVPGAKDILVSVVFSNGYTLNGEVFFDSSLATPDYKYVGFAKQSVAATTPIPGSLLLMGSGLIGMIGLYRINRDTWSR